MNLKTPVDAELDAIFQMIAAHRAGIGMGALEMQLAASQQTIARRTLRRRLDTLLQQKRIMVSGVGRATLYQLAVDQWALLEYPRHIVSPILIEQEREPYIALSGNAWEVRDQVRQPLQGRKPVGYQSEFLDNYRPNQDFYLSPEQLARLHQLGQTPGPVRPAGTHARGILGRLLIDLSWASSRLEGNTYSHLDTMRLLEYGQAAVGKNAEETQMILNHKAAIEMLVENAAEIGFNRFTLLNLHALLSDNLMPDPRASGRLRTCPVEIGASVYLPLAFPPLLHAAFDRLLEKIRQITDPFEQAFFAMVHLPYLQPFEDVNKRVARLAANIPLVRHNLCPLSFVDVPQRAYVEAILGVYELNRTDMLADVFVWAYERSCQRYLAIRQTLGEPDAFRLKHRNALIHAAQQIVCSDLPGTDQDILQFVPADMSDIERQAFVDSIHNDLDFLYEGNVARFRLKFSDYERWRFKRCRA